MTPEYIDEKIKEIHQCMIESSKMNEDFWTKIPKEFEEANETGKLLLILKPLGEQLITAINSFDILSYSIRRVATLLHGYSVFADYFGMSNDFLDSRTAKLSHSTLAGIRLLKSLKECMATLQIVHDNDIDPKEYREKTKELILDIIDYLLCAN
jgi:hypothetical protein